MATWRKVIVSGSTANLANVQVDGLTSGNVVIGGGSGSVLSTTAINGTGNIVATTGATVNMSGSFSGSFKGDGSNLSGVFATAIFPTTPRTDVTSGDKFFISQSTGQEFITYGNLLADLAGTNLAVESTDSLTLATTITGLTSVTSTTFVGNLTGTATTASFVTTAQTASYVLQAVSASFATNATNATTATNATNVTVTDTTIGGTHFLTFTTGSSGTQGLRVDSNGPTVNPSQNSISATSFTGSLQGTATSASYVVTAQTASYVNGNIFTGTNSATSASYALSSSLASTVTTNANLTGDVISTGNATTLATVNSNVGSFGSSTAIPSFTVNGKGLVTAASTNVVIAPAGTLTGNTLAAGVTNSSLTSLGTISSLTATNATITGNLTVQGTASFQNTTNLEVADRFVLFASGSNTAGDGGIVVQQGTQNVGELYGYDSDTKRWAFTSSFTANQAAFTPAAYITTTEFANSAPPLFPTYGSSSFGFGNIYVNTGTGDIFIYA
jgi:hypothetical protein